MQTIKRPTGSVNIVPLFGQRNGVDSESLDGKTLREVIDLGNNQIWPGMQTVLAGRPPHIQAAILAHVTSLWLTAYSVNGMATVEPMLVAYINLVRQLTVLNSRVVNQMMETADGGRV